MTGPALLAGHPGAARAASVLDAGGVLARDATVVVDGMVTVEVWRGEHLVATVKLPGAFSPGIDPPLVLSPEAATTLGDPPQRYLGSIVELSRPLSDDEQRAAASLLEERAPLAWPRVSASETIPLREAALMGGVALALAATAVATALARAQASADLATMHAVGADRGFLGRYLAAQVGLIVALGAPLGLVGGVALGGYAVAMARIASGGWRLTVVDWPGQALLLAGVVAVAAVASRPPRAVVARRQ